MRLWGFCFGLVGWLFLVDVYILLVLGVFYFIT